MGRLAASICTKCSSILTRLTGSGSPSPMFALTSLIPKLIQDSVPERGPGRNTRGLEHPMYINALALTKAPLITS